MRSKKTLIIGLAGFPGAGKTTVTEYLKGKGFTRITLSDFIKEEAEKRGVHITTREEYQDWGNAMRKEFGPGVLVRRAVDKANKKKMNKVVIDGVRNPGEVSYLKGRGEFLLYGIVATTKLRYERIVKRKGSARAGTYADFLKQERRERELGSDEAGQRVTDCLKLADRIVHNNTSLKDLYHLLDHIW